MWDVRAGGPSRLSLDPVADEPDDATLAAIEEGNAQIDRGEGIEFHQFAAETRKRYASMSGAWMSADHRIVPSPRTGGGSEGAVGSFKPGVLLKVRDAVVRQTGAALVG